MGRETLFGEPAFEIDTPHTRLHSSQLTLPQLLPRLDLNPHLVPRAAELRCPGSF